MVASRTQFCKDLLVANPLEFCHLNFILVPLLHFIRYSDNLDQNEVLLLFLNLYLKDNSTQ